MPLRFLIAVVIALALGTGATVRANNDAGLPPVAAFFDNNAFSAAILSPSGNHLAVRMSKPGRRNFLAVINLETKAAVVAAEYNDFDISSIRWVNDERLVYTVVDLAEVVGDRVNVPGLFAVNRDGSKRMQLASHSYGGDVSYSWNTFLLDQRGSQDSEWIYVQRPFYDPFSKRGGNKLARLNTLTRATEKVPGPDVRVSDYMLDAKGEPRLAIEYAEDTTNIFHRDPATSKWRGLTSFKIYNDENEIQPLGFGFDGTLYVIANAGEDLATLRRFDIATGKVDKEALVATPGYDFTGSLIRSDKLLGVRVTTDAENDIWFDPAMKALQDAINKALPRTINMLTVPARTGSPWVLVQSYSDMQPSTYSLYNRTTKLFDPIGEAYPKIDPARMGTQVPIRYKARDGLEIPGLLTLPAGGVHKNLPMVVLVHGGPWVRGASWGWDPQSQFLASRGYAVLEVEFRGSAGFGARHYQAGMKQWGLAMQDDIADGTRWAIAQGIADPRRICIAGASYGGYAALMGLVKDPELYQCAFEWLGVTDIALMFTGTWDTEPNFSETYKRYGMPILVGDLEKDAAQLKATSPLEHAARIRQPLLLAYGSEDRRVPLHHGKRFSDMVRKTNKRVEWVVYDGEGHGWSLPKNRIDFWQRVERFLNKNIGAAKTP